MTAAAPSLELLSMRVKEWLQREHGVLAPAIDIEDAMHTPCSYELELADPWPPAITFYDLVEYGKANGGNIVNGMPWSFTYKGHHVTHENDNCYLICKGGVTLRFERGQRLAANELGAVVIPAWPLTSAALQADPVAVAWRDAIIDGLVVAHVYRAEHDTDPRKALHDLICWEVDVALDPKVSDRAAALVAMDATQELSDWRELFAALCEQGIDALDSSFTPTPLWPNSWNQETAYVAKVLHDYTTPPPTALQADRGAVGDSWRRHRMINLPKADEPGKRVVGFVIDANDSDPMLPRLLLERIITAAPAAVSFRNLPDGATFEDYRDQLAIGNLTAVDQMGFDNLLHDRLEEMPAAGFVLVPKVPTAEMIACARRLIPAVPEVCMVVAIEDAIAAGARPTDEAPAKGGV